MLSYFRVLELHREVSKHHTTKYLHLSQIATAYRSYQHAMHHHPLPSPDTSTTNVTQSDRVLNDAAFLGINANKTVTQMPLQKPVTQLPLQNITKVHNTPTTHMTELQLEM